MLYIRIMFGILSRNRHKNKEAELCYALCLSQARDPVFYTDMSVPDTFDGRFEILLLHVFILMRVAGDMETDFNQSLFDVFFKDMDQTLREMGIGDMGIAKRMRKMMKGFNGRVHAYRHDLEQGIRTNVYGTCDAPDEQGVTLLKAYIEDTIKELSNMPFLSIKNAQLTFKVS